MARAAELAADGHDVEAYLDGVAAQAFATLYPTEVDLHSLYARRRIGRVSEAVVDEIAFVTLCAELE